MALAAGLGGCARSAYMVDRSRDAADIFTATAVGGMGAKARAGFLQTGLFGGTDLAGLRLGQIYHLASPDQIEYGFTPFPGDASLVFFGFESSTSGRLAVERKKAYLASQILVVSVPWLLGDMPFDRPDYVAYSYFTEIEVTAALFGGIRFGVNPGELVDFILGWATVDIFKDDIGILGETTHDHSEE